MKKNILILATIIIIALLALTYFRSNTKAPVVSSEDVTVLTWQEQYDLGMKYLSDGNYEEAIIAFNAAIELEPKNADAYIALADAYIELGDTNSASEILNAGLAETGDTALSDKLALLTAAEEKILSIPEEDVVLEDELLLQLAGTTWKLDYETFYEQNSEDAYAVFGSLLQQSNILSFDDSTFLMAAGGAGAAGGGTGTYVQNAAAIDYEILSLSGSNAVVSGTWEIVELDGEIMILTMYSGIYEAGFTDKEYKMYWIQQ